MSEPMSQTTTPPNAPEVDVLAAVRIELIAAMHDPCEPWSETEKHPTVKRFDVAVKSMLTREAALVAELLPFRELATSAATPGAIVWPNEWPQDVAMIANRIWQAESERDALAAEVGALRENAAAERNRGIMDAQGLLHEVSSKHRSAAATAYAQELLNALMQKYAETQAAARAPATIGGDAT